jgi:hypothetical protein
MTIGAYHSDEHMEEDQVDAEMLEETDTSESDDEEVYSAELAGSGFEDIQDEEKFWRQTSSKAEEPCLKRQKSKDPADRKVSMLFVPGATSDLASFVRPTASYLDKKSLCRTRTAASVYAAVLEDLAINMLFKELGVGKVMGIARPPSLARQKVHALYFKNVWDSLTRITKPAGRCSETCSTLVRAATWIRQSGTSGWGDCGRDWKNVADAACKAMSQLLDSDSVLPVTTELLKDIGEQDDAWDHFLVQWFSELMLGHRAEAMPILLSIFDDRSGSESQLKRRILYKALRSKRIREDRAHVHVLMSKYRLRGMTQRDASILTQGSTGINPNYPGGALALVHFIRTNASVEKWFESAWASMEKTERTQLSQTLRGLLQVKDPFKVGARVHLKANYNPEVQIIDKNLIRGAGTIQNTCDPCQVHLRTANGGEIIAALPLGCLEPEIQQCAMLALSALARGRINSLIAAGDYAALSGIVAADV